MWVKAKKICIKCRKSYEFSSKGSYNNGKCLCGGKLKPDWSNGWIN